MLFIIFFLLSVNRNIQIHPLVNNCTSFLKSCYAQSIQRAYLEVHFISFKANRNYCSPIVTYIPVPFKNLNRVFSQRSKTQLLVFPKKESFVILLIINLSYLTSPPLLSLPLYLYLTPISLIGYTFNTLMIEIDCIRYHIGSFKTT